MKIDDTIGIIGCGLIADTHVEAIRDAVPGAQIAVCDPLPGKADLLRRKYDLKSAYTSIEDLLSAERPFAAHILSPPQLHVSHASQCLDAGCHVLVEKPLCFSRKEAEGLYTLARSRSLALCVNHSLLFQPSVARMMEILKKKPGSRVVHVRSYYGLEGEGMARGSGIQEWKRTIPGGLMMDAVVHPVSLAVALAGAPARVCANQAMRDGQVSELQVSWETDSGVVGITVSASGQPFRRVTEVVTTDMSFVVDHSTEVLVSLPQTPGPKALGKLIRNLSHGLQLETKTLSTVWHVARGRIKQNPGSRGLVKAFYDSLLSKKEMPVSESNAADTVQVLENIVQAIGTSSGAGVPKSTPSASPGIPPQPAIRTLVTGASGFLGRVLCEQLAADGRRSVIALTRRGPNAEKMKSSPLVEKRFVDFKYFSPQDYQDLLQGVSEVVHCAHASGAKTWEDYLHQNVNATLSLYDAAAKAGCRRFVHISSVAVHGVHNRKPNLVSEASPLVQGKSIWDFYIRSKAQADRQLLERAKNATVPLLLLRPGLLYLADGTRLLSKSIPLTEGRLLIEIGNGTNRLPYTRVDVLAQTIVRALNAEHFPTGDYIVTGSMSEASRQFRKARLEALGMKCKFLSVPACPLRPLAAVLEFIYQVLRSRRPPKLTRYILDSACRDLVYDCSKAQKDLGWDPEAAIRM